VNQSLELSCLNFLHCQPQNTLHSVLVVNKHLRVNEDELLRFTSPAVKHFHTSSVSLNLACCGIPLWLYL